MVGVQCRWSGWNWPGPGAYANDYFQCFLWKTTVGQAYDILFLMIFISFIVLFASAFFWPRWRAKTCLNRKTIQNNFSEMVSLFLLNG
jgi:hypothetical protein